MAEKIEKKVKETVEKKYIAEVTTGCLNVRKSPSLDADVIIFIKRGIIVNVIQPKVNKGWVKISTDDGKVTGYVMKEFVKLKEVK